MKKITLIFSLVIVHLFTACYDENDRPIKLDPTPNSDGIIFADLSGSALQNALEEYFSARDNINYDQARDSLYGSIELNDSNQLSCLYTGYTVTVDPKKDATEQMDAVAVGGNKSNNINAEHVVPQSLFNSVEPMVSDLHHLFPSVELVNSARGSYPFGEFFDSDTSKWYIQDEILSTDPVTGEAIDYSRLSKIKNSDGTYMFQPRDAKKGDVARACIYFYVVYRSDVDAKKAIAFISKMMPILRQWDKNDPVDAEEITRNARIKKLQGNDNPFVVDPTLVDRIQ